MKVLCCVCFVVLVVKVLRCVSVALCRCCIVSFLYGEVMKYENVALGCVSVACSKCCTELLRCVCCVVFVVMF